MAMDIKQKAFEIHQKLWALTKKYLEPDMLQTNQTDKYWDDLIADYNGLLESLADDPKYVNEFAENMVVGITRLLEGIMREEHKKDV
jgi:predicted RNA-binding protein with EMAP domain